MKAALSPYRSPHLEGKVSKTNISQIMSAFKNVYHLIRQQLITVFEYNTVLRPTRNLYYQPFYSRISGTQTSSMVIADRCPSTFIGGSLVTNVFMVNVKYRFTLITV